VGKKLCDRDELFYFYFLFIWFDAMAAYKQIMPGLTTALTGMQK